MTSSEKMKVIIPDEVLAGADDEQKAFLEAFKKHIENLPAGEFEQALHDMESGKITSMVLPGDITIDKVERMENLDDDNG